MIIQKFDNEKDWLEARLGRITGTRLKDIVGSKRDGSFKIGFYEIIAERVAIPADDERAIDRGKRLEDEAVELFRKRTGLKVKNDLEIWYREDAPNIAFSPDGSIGKSKACEVKCLSSARHLEAWHTKKIPSEYDWQVLQAFIVNDKLQKLYFIFYDPRMPIDLFWFEVDRKDLQEKIDEYREFEIGILSELEGVEKQLTF